MNFRGSDQQQDETGIELTPLIDVVFLLLIFFMISTTFTKQTTLKINLPEANQQADKREQPNKVEVFVSSEAEYALTSDTESESRKLVNSNRKTLYRALQDYAEAGDLKTLVLVIRADKDAPHGAVIRVMDVAKQLNWTNISFATKSIQDQAN